MDGPRRPFLPLALAGGLAVASLGLTACGGGGGDGGGDDPPTDVNERPSASISDPADGAGFDPGQSITFQGSGDDPEDGALTGGSLAWESDEDGPIGSGRTVTVSDLSVASHQVTLTATDSDGATDTDQVSIAVSSPPSASITSPESGETFGQNGSVTLEGSGDDPEDGALAGDALVWESDRDGQVGTGATATASGLSTGGHQISLTATDSHGRTASDQVSITVEQVPGSIAVDPELVSILPGADTTLQVDVQDVDGQDFEDPELAATSRDPAVATASGTQVSGASDGVTDVVIEATSPFTETPVTDSSRVAVVQTDGFYAIVSRSVDEVEVPADAGASVTVQLLVVPSPDAAGSIGSIEGSFTWDPALLDFDQGAAAQDAEDRDWTVITNFNDAGSGEARFSAFTTGSTSETFALLEATYTAGGGAGERAVLDLSITAAGDEEGQDISGKVESVDSQVEIE